MRELTLRQTQMLDGIADREPDTRVIGWSGLGRGGPVVRFTDGTESLIPYSGKVSARIAGTAA